MSNKMGTNHYRLFRPLSLIVSAASIAMLANGCGGQSGIERPAVSGTVLLDGQPIESGTISFVPAPGTKGPTAGGIIKSGKYSISEGDGAAVGTARVEISSSKATGKMIEVGSPMPPGTKIEETIEAVPTKYNKNSTLTVEIKAAANTHDFDLKSK